MSERLAELERTVAALQRENLRLRRARDGSVKVSNLWATTDTRGVEVLRGTLGPVRILIAPYLGSRGDGATHRLILLGPPGADDQQDITTVAGRPRR